MSALRESGHGWANYEYRLATPSDGASLNCADRACLERAADPLHRAGVNSKPSGNDPYTGPPRSRQSLADSLFQCGGDWRTSEAFTLTPGPREASTDSFLNHRPFELGKYAHHPKHPLRGMCRRGVQPLLVQEQVDLEGV